MRESAETKGRRYLAEGRLLVTRVDGNTIQAACRCDGGIYELGHDPRRGRRWRARASAPVQPALFPPRLRYQHRGAR